MLKHAGYGYGYGYLDGQGSGCGYDCGCSNGDGISSGYDDGYGGGWGDGWGDDQGGITQGRGHIENPNITELVINDDPLTTSYQSTIMQIWEDINDRI